MRPTGKKTDTPETVKELTPAKKLDVMTFEVIVNRGQVITPEMGEFLGAAVTNESNEYVQRHGSVRTRLSVIKLAEIHSCGGYPVFMRARETVEIYKLVCDYLVSFRAAYSNNAQNPMNKEVLMANVVKLENFAEWVFGIAHPYFPKDDLANPNSLVGRLGRGRFSRSVFNAKEVEAKRIRDELAARNQKLTLTKESQAELPSHERITDGVVEDHFVKQSAANRFKNDKSYGWS